MTSPYLNMWKCLLSIYICVCEELTHLKRPWCWERLRAGGEGDDRGWDGWMASPTWWTWVWIDSGSWWWTGRPGVLRFVGSQRVIHDWVTELTDWWSHYNFWVKAYKTHLTCRGPVQKLTPRPRHRIVLHPSDPPCDQTPFHDYLFYLWPYHS